MLRLRADAIGIVTFPPTVLKHHYAALANGREQIGRK